jgi:hypothetical protein
MVKLAVLVALVTGCLSHARPARVVEEPDPVIGDLRCATPRISILDALYHGPVPAPAPEQCEARD